MPQWRFDYLQMEYEKKKKNQVPGVSLTNPGTTAAYIAAQSQENNWSKLQHLFFKVLITFLPRK